MNGDDNVAGKQITYRQYAEVHDRERDERNAQRCMKGLSRRGHHERRLTTFARTKQYCAKQDSLFRTLSSRLT